MAIFQLVQKAAIVAIRFSLLFDPLLNLVSNTLRKRQLLLHTSFIDLEGSLVI
jgi:hypothetical protein